MRLVVLRAAALGFATCSLFVAPKALAMAAAPDKPIQSTFVYQQGNLTYDLSAVYDGALQKQLYWALDLGHQRVSQGGRKIGKLVSLLRGDGRARTIRFFSRESDASPGGAIGSPALAFWRGPRGDLDMTSSPSSRYDIRVFVRPKQPYWYVVNSVWHELQHVTLQVTHRQTTPEGSMPTEYVNDGVWYPTIKGVMYDFPRFATDPDTGRQTELYDPESNPWS